MVADAQRAEQGEHQGSFLTDLDKMDADRFRGSFSGDEKDVFFINDGGGFFDAHALLGFDDVLDGRAVVPIDVNGDGRLEVVVMTRRSAVLLDALTGAIRWRLPNDAFDTEVPVRLSQLIIADLTGDQIDDLYVTDGGCNDEGSGRGAAFSFADGFDGARINVVSGPRV